MSAGCRATRDDAAIVWHNGTTAGFNGLIGFDSAGQRGAVVLANAITVTTEGGHLYIRANGQARFEAFPESETGFVLTVVDAQITFTRSADGATTALVLHQNGRDLSGARQ